MGAPGGNPSRTKAIRPHEGPALQEKWVCYTVYLNTQLIVNTFVATFHDAVCFLVMCVWVIYSTLMNTMKEDSRKARRGQRASLLGPAERSERRYLRNYDDLDDDSEHGGGGRGGGGGGGSGGGLGGAGKNLAHLRMV